MLIQIAVSSLEKIRVRIESSNDQGQPVNPTTDTVQFAFTADRMTEPQSGDWVLGSWSTWAPGGTIKPVYRAVCLVGPGGAKTLTAGRYWIWVRVTDNPEIPVLSAGELQVGEVGP